MKRTTLILTAFVTVAFATMTKADGLNFHDLSPEEQALYDKGAYQETYDTSKHSGHEIDCHTDSYSVGTLYRWVARKPLA